MIQTERRNEYQYGSGRYIIQVTAEVHTDKPKRIENYLDDDDDA